MESHFHGVCFKCHIFSQQLVSYENKLSFAFPSGFKKHTFEVCARMYKYIAILVMHSFWSFGFLKVEFRNGSISPEN